MKRMLRLAVIVLAALVVSGCASTRTAQEVKRLQAQVGLLDERLTQLERSGGTWPSTAAMTEPLTEPTAAVSISPASSARSAKGTGASTSSKPSTRQIQQALKNAGFYQGSVDGKMGPVTREAIKEFQRINGLTDDGVVGKKTWAKLSAYAELSSDSVELSAAEILK